VTADPDPNTYLHFLRGAQNLTVRMSMRRSTRADERLQQERGKPRGRSALYFMYYNFGRVHKTLRVARRNGVARHRRLRERSKIPISGWG
jgi:hypothetical protein